MLVKSPLQARATFLLLLVLLEPKLDLLPPIFAAEFEIALVIAVLCAGATVCIHFELFGEVASFVVIKHIASCIYNYLSYR